MSEKEMKITKAYLVETSSKALINMIPGVGGAVASVISDYLAERNAQRFQEFIDQLSADFQEFKDSVNKNITEQDAFLDILELTIKKVVSERNAVKRLAYKNIITNSSISRDADFDDIEQCIRLLEATTENNILLLKVLSNPESQNERMGFPIKKKSNTWGTTSMEQILRRLLPQNWDSNRILDNIKDLEYLWLIKNQSSSFKNIITNMQNLEVITNWLTGKGERFIEFIKSPTPNI